MTSSNTNMKRKLAMGRPLAAPKHMANTMAETDDNVDDSGSRYDYNSVIRPPQLDPNLESELRKACAYILKDLKPSGHDLEDTRMKTDILVEGDDLDMDDRRYPLEPFHPRKSGGPAGKQISQKTWPLPENSAAQNRERGPLSQKFQIIQPSELDQQRTTNLYENVAPVEPSQRPSEKRSGPGPPLAPMSSVSARTRAEPMSSGQPASQDTRIRKMKPMDSSRTSSLGKSTNSTNHPQSTGTGATSTMITSAVASQRISDNDVMSVPPEEENTNQEVAGKRQMEGMQSLEPAQSPLATHPPISRAMGSNLEAQAMPIIHNRAASRVSLTTDGATLESVSRTRSIGDTKIAKTFAEVPHDPRLKYAPVVSDTSSVPRQVINYSPKYDRSVFMPVPAREEPANMRMPPTIPVNQDKTSVPNPGGGTTITEEEDVSSPEPHLAINPKNPRRFRGDEEAARMRELMLLNIKDKSEEPLATARARLASGQTPSSSTNQATSHYRPTSMSIVDAKPQPLNLRPKSGNAAAPLQGSNSGMPSPTLPITIHGNSLPISVPTSGQNGVYGQALATSDPQQGAPAPVHIPVPMPSIAQPISSPSTAARSTRHQFTNLPPLKHHLDESIVIKDFWTPSAPGSLKTIPRLNTGPLKQRQVDIPPVPDSTATVSPTASQIDPVSPKTPLAPITPITNMLNSSSFNVAAPSGYIQQQTPQQAVEPSPAAMLRMPIQPQQNYFPPQVSAIRNFHTPSSSLPSNIRNENQNARNENPPLEVMPSQLTSAIPPSNSMNDLRKEPRGLKKLMYRLGGGEAPDRRMVYVTPSMAVDEEDLYDDQACAAPVVRFGKGW